jgi:phosphohistidine phosphatase
LLANERRVGRLEGYLTEWTQGGIAKHLRRKRIRPALVLCSPSLRTRQTLEAIEPSLGKGCSVELAAELYAASGQKLLERLRALPESADSVMLIGHNPGLQERRLNFYSNEGFTSRAVATTR